MSRKTHIRGEINFKQRYFEKYPTGSKFDYGIEIRSLKRAGFHVRFQNFTARFPNNDKQHIFRE